MAIYGVTIKHLQNIHKPMPSVDNTFISMLYLQIKSSYSEHVAQTLLSASQVRREINRVCVTSYNISILISFTYPRYLQTNKGYKPRITALYKIYNRTSHRISHRTRSKMTNNFSLITVYKYIATQSHFLKMLYISQSQMGDFFFLLFYKDSPHGIMMWK